MQSPKRVGRIIGVLLFVQLALLILPFVLLLPVTSADFLETAAPHALQIRAAVLLLFATGALTTAIALLAYPYVRSSASWMAPALLAASVLWLGLQAVDNALIMTLLSLSERYAAEGGGGGGPVEALGELARASRRWTHYTALLGIEVWFGLFYGALFRSALAPRALAAFGVLMALVHAAALTLPTFAGGSGMPALAPSLGLAHVAMGSWLVAKGFRMP
jgi:hypothetical protein